jgi:hypothetical protein
MGSSDGDPRCWINSSTVSIRDDDKDDAATTLRRDDESLPRNDDDLEVESMK